MALDGGNLRQFDGGFHWAGTSSGLATIKPVLLRRAGLRAANESGTATETEHSFPSPRAAGSSRQSLQDSQSIIAVQTD